MGKTNKQPKKTEIKELSSGDMALQQINVIGQNLAGLEKGTTIRINQTNRQITGLESDVMDTLAQVSEKFAQMEKKIDDLERKINAPPIEEEIDGMA